MGRKPLREDASDADLFRLIVDDLSQGRIIRQHRDVNSQGQFLKARAAGIGKPTPSTTTISAFDRDKKYELTNLGNDFIHFAAGDLPVKIEFKPEA